MADNRNMVLQLLITARDLASAPLRALVSSIKFLDSEISVVSGKIRAAFSGLFGGGLEGALEFEAQLSKIAAKGGFTAAEMEKLKQAATEMGAQFGTTGTEAAQGMEALAAAGLNAEQVMQALPPVLALASAEGISMDVAAERLSDSLSSVGLGFDQAARMANVLAKGANLSTTSASALAEALATTGGIARTAGLTLEQTVGALSALANAGIKGGQAGTALSAILTQLLNPASQASQQLSALGISSRDLGEVLGQLQAQGDASNAAILAFGDTAGPGLRALLKTGQEGLTGLSQQLLDSKGDAEAAATGISQNLKGALASLQAAWNNVKTALFDPVLKPLTEQANELAKTLNAQLNTGALQPVQAAIRSFVDNGIVAARDFIRNFDFAAVLKAVQDFASGAKEAFSGIADSGRIAASVVQIAWNAVTTGFKTIGAGLLAVAASAVANVAAVEAAASKIGLGSMARANELQTTANELAAKAESLTQSIAQDGKDIQTAFDRLKTVTEGAATGIKNVATAQQEIKDSNPAAEIQDIVKSLDDYRGMADRANVVTQQARNDFEAGKISAAEYGLRLLDAADANQTLAEATDRQATAEQKAAPLRQKTAVELQAAATAAENVAKSQENYTSALQKVGDQQADAIRSEIELAIAKGDTATVALKTIKLAQIEANTAVQVATAKEKEVASLKEVITAQKVYLDSVGGGTAIQQQELQILQLKLVALQAEAQQAGNTAQVKAITAQQAITQQQQTTQNTQENTQAVQKNSEAQETNIKHIDNSGIALRNLNIFLQQTRNAMGELSEVAQRYYDVEFTWQLQSQGFRGAFEAHRSAIQALNAAFAGHSDKLADYAGKLQNAFALEERGLNRMAFAMNGFAKAEAAAEIAAGRTQQAYYRQAMAAEQLRITVENMAAGNVTAARELAQAAQQAETGFRFLDEEDLSGLRQAIADANDRMRELQEETQTATDRLQELNAEIAAERGDKATSDRLKLQLEQQQALAEVEAKLAEAEAANNQKLIRIYNEQLEKLKTLYALKEKNLEQENKRREQEQSSTAPSKANTSNGSRESGMPTGKIYTLNLTSGNKTLTAQTNTDPQQFLNELTAAKNRSLG